MNATFPSGARVSTKICPNCNAEVPQIANLCRHCFHDFHVVAPKRKSPWWTLLFLGVGTSLVASLAFNYMYGQFRTQNISIDKETESIVFTTKTPDNIDAQRVFWKDVASVEYVRNTRPMTFMVYVVTSRGERHVYAGGNDPIDFKARELAELIGKPVVEIDEYDGPKIERRN